MKRSVVSSTVVVSGLIVLVTGAFIAHIYGRGLHYFPETPRWDLPEADVKKGRLAIIQYGCPACHVIPGIRSAKGRVGPKLEDFGTQVFIAGMLSNTPENLIRWIQNPQEVNPGTAMPTLGVTEEEARNIAAYLYAGS